jgi:hypothetical protein
MFIIHIPELNTHEYIEFYNLSGTCELKTKLRIKSYDKILRYLRKQNIQDAENITALVDYKTGAHISESPNIAQYTQFIIIRHPTRSKYLMDLSDTGLTYPHNGDILYDDRDFVIRYILYDYGYLGDMVFYSRISNRLKSDKKIVKLILEDEIWNSNNEETINSPLRGEVINGIQYINSKRFMLKNKNLVSLYPYLPYKLQLDIDIIYNAWLLFKSTCRMCYINVYYFLFKILHPDVAISDVIRRCIDKEYYITLSTHFPKKLDKDMWTRVLHQAECKDNAYLRYKISGSECLTDEELMQILDSL